MGDVELTPANGEGPRDQGGRLGWRSSGPQGSGRRCVPEASPPIRGLPRQEVARLSCSLQTQPWAGDSWGMCDLTRWPCWIPRCDSWRLSVRDTLES